MPPNAARHAFLACVLSVVLLSVPGFARADEDADDAGTERVSVAADGSPANAPSVPGGGIGISGDGRFVVFSSRATNLVDRDTKGIENVFVYDRAQRVTDIVSVDQAGRPATETSHDGAISAGGRYVAFVSTARLSPDAPDTPSRQKLYVRDRERAETRLIAVETASGVTLGKPSLSADGRRIAWLAEGSATGASIFDQTTRATVDFTGSASSGGLVHAQLAADGRHVAFTAVGGSDFCPAETAPAIPAVLEKDLGAGSLLAPPSRCARVSTMPDGADAGGERTAISADGRWVAFASRAPILGPGTGCGGIFVRDTARGTTRAASVASDGTPANGLSTDPAISADGRWVAFASTATNLAGDGGATEGCVPATGGPAALFVHDRVTGATVLAAPLAAGLFAAVNGVITSPSLSADGRFVAFAGRDLLPGDPPGVLQTYVRGPLHSRGRSARRGARAS